MHGRGFPIRPVLEYRYLTIPFCDPCFLLSDDFTELALPGRELDRVYLRPGKKKNAETWGSELESLSVTSDAAKDIVSQEHRPSGNMVARRH